MSNKRGRWNLSALTFLSLVIGGRIGWSAPEVNPQSQPSAHQTRSPQELWNDFVETDKLTDKVIPSNDVYLDAVKRREAAPRALPLLRRMLDDLHGMNASDNPKAKKLAQHFEGELLPLLSLLGDKDATATLEAQAQSADKSESAAGRAAMLRVQWLKNAKDSAAQKKLADQAEEIARDDPENDQVTRQIISMSETGAASHALADRLQEAASQMKTSSGATLKMELDSLKKLHAMVGKPLAVEGTRNGGGTFSTTDWKGKVVVVDFWATWCQPCMQELPHVKKVYAQYHPNGLELLGVSCDNNPEALSKFLAKNSDMPWPQLFDAEHPGWSEVAKHLDIVMIPTMFVIDKKGILRSVDGVKEVDTLLPKLLAE